MAEQRYLPEQGEIPDLVKLAPQRLVKRIIRTHDEPSLRAIVRDVTRAPDADQ